MNYRSQIIQDDMERMFHQIESKEKLYNTTVLITGASGMLATYMTYYLMYLNEKDNANIHVLALVRNEEKAWKKFADFRNEEQFDLLVQDVCEPIKFLRQREIVHFQRFGEALRITQDKLNAKNFYAFNPGFDKCETCEN